MVVSKPVCPVFIFFHPNIFHHIICHSATFHFPPWVLTYNMGYLLGWIVITVLTRRGPGVGCFHLFFECHSPTLFWLAIFHLYLNWFNLHGFVYEAIPAVNDSWIDVILSLNTQTISEGSRAQTRQWSRPQNIRSDGHRPPSESKPPQGYFSDTWLTIRKGGSSSGGALLFSLLCYRGESHTNKRSRVWNLWQENLVLNPWDLCDQFCAKAPKIVSNRTPL